MVSVWQLLAVGGGGLSLSLGLLAAGRKADETNKASLGICLKVAGVFFSGFFAAGITMAIVLKLLFGVG